MSTSKSRIDLTGQQLGRLMVLSEAEPVRYAGTAARRWECRCTCGTIKVIHQSHLRSGKIQSCGCLHRDTVTSSLTDKQRFQEKFQELNSGCWQWTAALDSRTGYGKFWMDGQCWQAHRAAVRLYTRRRVNPPGPFDFHSKQIACHSCDNRWCVNPAHVFFGTQKDNMRDMIQKGRQVVIPKPGERNGRCVLTDAEVQKLRDMYETGEYQQKELAAMFNIGTSQCNRIVRKLVRP